MSNPAAAPSVAARTKSACTASICCAVISCGTWLMPGKYGSGEGAHSGQLPLLNG